MRACARGRSPSRSRSSSSRPPAVALCVAPELEPDQALGVLLVAVTPPTVGASVFTFPPAATRRPRRELGRLAVGGRDARELRRRGRLQRARPRRAPGRRPAADARPPRRSRRQCSCSPSPPRAARRAQGRGAARARQGVDWRALKVVVPVCVVSFVRPTRCSATTTAATARGAWFAAVSRAPRPPRSAAPRGASARPRATRSSTVMRRNPVIMFGVAALGSATRPASTSTRVRDRGRGRDDARPGLAPAFLATGYALRRCASSSRRLTPARSAASTTRPTRRPPATTGPARASNPPTTSKAPSRSMSPSATAGTDGQDTVAARQPRAPGPSSRAMAGSATPPASSTAAAPAQCAQLRGGETREASRRPSASASNRNVAHHP